MKVNKAIFLTYDPNSVNATTSINVNFPVKSIHIKSCAYSSTLPTPADTQQYITLFSDLTNGEPLATIYNDSGFSAQQFCDVSFQPYKPITVNGTYNFYLKTVTGAGYVDAETNYITLILEFNGVDTPDH
jgi:hypothetical protein